MPNLTETSNLLIGNLLSLKPSMNIFRRLMEDIIILMLWSWLIFSGSKVKWKMSGIWRKFITKNYSGMEVDWLILLVFSAKVSELLPLKPQLQDICSVKVSISLTWVQNLLTIALLQDKITLEFFYCVKLHVETWMKKPMQIIMRPICHQTNTQLREWEKYSLTLRMQYSLKKELRYPWAQG